MLVGPNFFENSSTPLFYDHYAPGKEIGFLTFTLFFSSAHWPLFYFPLFRSSRFIGPVTDILCSLAGSTSMLCAREVLRGGASSLETLADFYEPRSTFGILAAFWNCFPPSLIRGWCELFSFHSVGFN